MDNFRRFETIFPPKFNVGSTNIKRFFKRFERYISVQNGNWNDQLKVNFLGNLLCNRSFDYFELIPDETKQVYEDTKENIIAHYDQSRSDLKQWSLLNRRRQLLNENVTSFYDDLISIMHKLWLPKRYYYGYF